MSKKEWKRGEKADAVSAIVLAFLLTNLKASVTDLCTVVQKEIIRQNLDINISPSILRNLLVAEKRPFCFVRIWGQGMFVTLTHELLLDIIQEMAEKVKSKVRHIGTAPGKGNNKFFPIRAKA